METEQFPPKHRKRIVEVLHQKSRIYSDAVRNGVWEGSGRVGRCTITEEHSFRKRVGFLWNACVIHSLEYRNTELVRFNKFPFGIIKLISLWPVQSPVWCVNRLQEMNLTMRYQDGNASLGFQLLSLPVHQLALSISFLTWSAGFTVPRFCSLTCPSSWDTQHWHCSAAVATAMTSTRLYLPAFRHTDLICWANQHLQSIKAWWVKPNSNWVLKERM